MSRIGKQIIDIPEKTELKVEGNSLTVKGPLGQLSRPIPNGLEVKIEGGKVSVLPKRNDSTTNVLWGTFTSHIVNMIQGVNKAYEKRLVVEGIGYKMDVKGQDLVLNVGFSHPVNLKIPAGIKAAFEKTTLIISGTDKDSVGQFSAMVRAQKKPEPYKGKGIRYEGEVIRRKQGKKTA